MPLSKLYTVYTFDTSCFYTDEEAELDRQLHGCREKIAEAKEAGDDPKELRRQAKALKEQLKTVIQSNLGLTRQVRDEALHERNLVAVFESNLVRGLGMVENQLNLEMVIVRVYYFGVAESIIKNGFTLNGEKYVFFSASAGQIRTKKFVAVNEKALQKCWNSITCGLSVEQINAQGGVNTNKYLAYLALCNSATDVWGDFDIEKCVVVDDFETLVTGTVDFIDPATYCCERKEMAVPITHTDGCGMIRTSHGKKNFMVRAPWIKGLLSPFPFDKFIREANRREPGVNHGLIQDIYGRQVDILADDIQIIFTKSQFKMWKYFKNWHEYQENFKKYECTAGICNVEEDHIPDAKFNYQMLQTLHDLSDQELETLCSRTNQKLDSLATDRQTMLKVFGAVAENPRRSPFQESLMIYPELLRDPYTKETLRDIKSKLERDAYAGKLDISGKYLFLLPDLYAFCQHLFLGEKVPTGLLGNGEVYSTVYAASRKLDCLRSPHLYIEHAVRHNVCGENGECKRWFQTKGVYTSSFDLISKILQFDVDGDKTLCCTEKTIIEAAERSSKDIVPLYYNMAKAEARPLSPQAYYDGMIAAYTGGNIGEISNSITKIWNIIPSDLPHLDHYLHIIKLLCMQNNFVIDYAKTLYKPTPPPDVQEDIRNAISGKLPAFFRFAKGKRDDQVKSRGRSVVDRLPDFIHHNRFNFSKQQIGALDYKVLMSKRDHSNSPYSTDIITMFQRLTRHITNRGISSKDCRNRYPLILANIEAQMETVCQDRDIVVDVLVKYLFHTKKSKKKAVLWDIYGDTILKNIKENIGKTVSCVDCGRRFTPSAYNQVRCPECQQRKRRADEALRHKRKPTQA